MPELLIIVAFVILILVVVWLHYLQQNKHHNVVDNSLRDATNVKLYHEHKAEIENDFQQGNIDQESYEYLLAELDQSLLQDIEDNEREQQGNKQSAKRIAIVWPIGLSIFLLAFSSYFYLETGAYQLVANTPKADPQQEQFSADQQLQQQIAQLTSVTEKEPQNSDAWYSLGQAYVGTGQFDQAITAFDKVIEIDGEHADLYGAKAQATYYKNGQKITQDVQLLIDQALALDLRDPSTNILLGMDNFINQNYIEAIQYWQMIVDDSRPSVNIEALIGAIAEAKNRLALTGDNADGGISPKLTLAVSVADQFKEQLSLEDKVVFVYAIPTQGSRQPVAAVKISASDLPAEVILDNSRAMTPQLKLSDVKQVHLFAVISSSGGVGIKSGDLKAELNNIDVMSEQTFELVIDRLVE